MKMSKSSPWILYSAALLSCFAASDRALAFGGLWSASDAPIKQSSERILLVDNPDSTVTAVVQLEYEGAPDQFAWIIPVPGKPTVAISSSIVFQRLDAATAPQYWVEETIAGTCSQADATDAGSSMDEASGASPVLTLDRGSVGPYDYVTLAVDSGLGDPAAVATDWLADNGFASTSLANDVLGSYLKNGLNLLALKLQPGSEARAIRPVSVTYDSDSPSIPIRLTAIAAKEDMGIQVWVVGPSQAVSDNYRSLVINDARIDWQSARKFKVGTLPSGGVGPFGEYVSKPDNYAAVVTAAANEANGRGFVTELGGPASQFRDKVWAQVDRDTFNTISTQTYADGIDAILNASGNYGGWDGWSEAVAGSVELPEGVTVAELVRNPEPYRGRVAVDTTKFFELLEKLTIAPVADTAALLYAAPYLTRLYTTMSADDMTVDPTFDYNFDLAQVSSVHIALQQVECSSELNPEDAPWRMQLPQGGLVSGEGASWPVADDSTPANLKVVKLSTTGSGVVEQDNSARIRERLDTVSSGTVLRPPQTGSSIGATQTIVPAPEGSVRSAPRPHADHGCSISRADSAAEGFALALVAPLASSIIAFRRQRRRRFALTRGSRPQGDRERSEQS
jgi:hypothetical protein